MLEIHLLLLMFASVLLFTSECGQMLRRTKPLHSFCSSLLMETPPTISEYFPKEAVWLPVGRAQTLLPPPALLPHFMSCEALPSSSTSCSRRKQVLRFSRSLVLFCVFAQGAGSCNPTSLMSFSHGGNQRAPFVKG